MAYPSGPNYRDVYGLLQWLRNVLTGRKPYLNHHRFEQLVAPRTLPKPDIPRGPEYKYSGQRYYNRNAIQSVEPPVVAPVGIGRSKMSSGGPGKPLKCETVQGDVDFDIPPTPGGAFWWDGHSYYKCIEDHPPRRLPRKTIPPEIPSHIRLAQRLESETPENPPEGGPCDPCEPKK